MKRVEDFNEVCYKGNFYEPYDIRIIINGERYIERYICNVLFRRRIFDVDGDETLYDEERNIYYNNSYENGMVYYVVRMIYKPRWEDGEFKLKRVNAALAYATINNDCIRPEYMLPEEKRELFYNGTSFAELIGKKNEWDFDEEEIKRIEEINKRDYEKLKERTIEKAIECSKKNRDKECRAYIYQLPEVLKRFSDLRCRMDYDFYSDFKWEVFEKNGAILLGRFHDGCPLPDGEEEDYE